MGVVLGSCAGMLRHHLPHPFDDDPTPKARAKEFADRTYEVVSFLAGVLHAALPTVAYDGVATYHVAAAACANSGSRRSPGAMLADVEGLNLVEMTEV